MEIKKTAENKEGKEKIIYLPDNKNILFFRWRNVCDVQFENNPNTVINKLQA